MRHNKCEDCRFYNMDDKYAGECRRHAPMPGQQMQDPDNDGVWAVWPPVSGSDWCGQWEHKAN